MAARRWINPSSSASNIEGAGFRVVFYPFLLGDIPGSNPWRGRVIIPAPTSRAPRRRRSTPFKVRSGHHKKVATPSREICHFARPSLTALFLLHWPKSIAIER
jgi:hypothetical protein